MTGKRKVRRAKKNKEPIIESYFDDNSITKTFFYNLDTLSISETPVKGVMLIIKNKKHEVGIEVNDDKAKIKLMYFNGAKKNSDISVEVTLQELVKFMHSKVDTK